MSYEDIMRRFEIAQEMAAREREAEARQLERWQEMKRQEAAFQVELRQRARGKPVWEWKRPWEC